MEQALQIGDYVRVVISKYSSRKDEGMNGVIIDRCESKIWDWVVDFGIESTFTHDADGRYGARRHFRYYNEIQLERINDTNFELDPITEEEFLQCLHVT